MYSWFKDDITWCANSETCENKNCFRHTCHKSSETKIYSMALFKDTDYCPSYFERSEENNDTD